MKHLILTVSGKGGVGKTLSARLIAETMRKTLPSALLVDGNGAVGQFLQYLGKRGQPNADGKRDLLVPQPEPEGVRVFNLHGDERDRDEIVRLLESGYDTIFADLPAESHEKLSTLGELAFFDLAERCGFRITFIAPVTPYRASVRDIGDILDLDERAQLIVVRNLGFGDAEDEARGEKGDFSIWNGSKAKEKALAHGAVVIDLPRCKAGILAELDDLSLSFEEGLQSPALDLADRQRLFVWLRNAREAVEPAFRALGIGKAVAA